MGVIISKVKDWETFLQLKALNKLLRTHKLLATDRYFQVSTPGFVVRFNSDAIPPGVYSAVFSGDLTVSLADNPAQQSDDMPVAGMGDGSDWQTYPVVCRSIEALQTDLMDIGNAHLSAVAAGAIVSRYTGHNITVVHRLPSDPVFISAPGMLMAVLPRVLKVNKLITGLPVSHRDALKAMAENRGTSVNRMILDAIARLIAGKDGTA